MSAAAAALAALLDRGLLDYYAYDGGEAYRTYAQAARLDPASAMAYWGEALALGPNINEPLTSDRFARAQPAIARAVALSASASPRDRALIAALALRYAGNWEARGTDEAAYRAAMTTLVAAYPTDDTIADIAAEAIADGGGDWHAVAALAEGVLARDPADPMANHLCIHAYDAAVDRTPAIACARRLDAMRFEPAQEHLAHMPAHVWIETGRYDLALISSDRGWQLSADLAASPEADHGHASYAAHDAFVGFAAAMYLADEATAMRWAQRANAGAHAVDRTSLVYARFGRWREILAESDPGDAMLPAARALALVHLGRFDEAVRAYGALGAEARASLPGVLAHARLLERDGKIETAAAALRALATEQYLYYSTEYVPPIPAMEAAGALYLRAGRYDDAVAAFRETLARYPDDPRANLGLAVALEKLGKNAEAVTARAAFARLWGGAPAPPLDDW